MLKVDALLAAAANTPPLPDRAARSWEYLSLWMGFAILAAVLVLTLVALVVLRHRARTAPGRRARRVYLQDAWVEAGRRASIPPPEPPSESRIDLPPDDRA